MIRVLIVDDEVFMRMGIKNAIDWNKEGYKIIAEASNGREAMSIMEEMDVDLVITDIKMPIMDGIELIKHMTSQYPSMKCIVLSNYNDFELVKKAMKHGAIDYLYKVTIDINELTNLLRELKKKITSNINEIPDFELAIEDQNIILRNTLIEISQGRLNKQDSKMLLNRFERCIPTLQGKIIILQINDYDNIIQHRFEGAEDALKKVVEDLVKEILTAEKSYKSVQIEKGIYLLFLHRKSTDTFIAEKLSMFIEEFLDLDTRIIYGINYKNYDEFYSHLKDIKRYMQWQFYNYKTLCCIQEENNYSYTINHLERYWEIKDQIDIYIHHHNFTAIEERLNEILVIFKKNLVAPEIVIRLMLSLLGQMSPYLIELNDDGEDIYKRYTEQYQQINYYRALVQCTNTWIKDFRKRVCKPEADKNKDIERALEFIKLNYHNKLTLEMAAYEVNLNRTYFAKLFKKIIGINFHEYLFKHRMEKAKALLLETDLKISDICFRVGYKDINHFNRSFKNFYKCSPSQIRKHGNEK
ncbi:response regulator transcription factor [Vallitalea okinawensis]|uniref:response regulator transcription factor n=1 Tax=Vallitalea okinawensis TaxID=2078660 RepID=UPI000CFE30CB|nr:response regulator [Vallitalea okinawensis]